MDLSTLLSVGKGNCVLNWFKNIYYMSLPIPKACNYLEQ